MNQTLKQAVGELIAAIQVESKSQPYHGIIMAKHRKEWPTLWKKLDAVQVQMQRLGDVDPEVVLDAAAKYRRRWSCTDGKDFVPNTDAEAFVKAIDSWTAKRANG